VLAAEFYLFVVVIPCSFFRRQMVLSACSSYFEQLFLEQPEFACFPGPMIVVMRETSFEDLSLIMEFMYKGEVNILQVNF
jgi:hypothetical protein